MRVYSTSQSAAALGSQIGNLPRISSKTTAPPDLGAQCCGQHYVYNTRLGIRVIGIIPLPNMRMFIRLFGTAIDCRVTRVVPATFHCDISYHSLPRAQGCKWLILRITVISRHRVCAGAVIHGDGNKSEVHIKYIHRAHNCMRKGIARDSRSFTYCELQYAALSVAL